MRGPKIGKIVSIACVLLGMILLLGISGTVNVNSDQFFLRVDDYDWVKSHLIPYSELVRNGNRSFTKVTIPRQDLQQCPAKEMAYYMHSILTGENKSGRSLLFDFQDGTGIWFQDVLKMQGIYGLLDSHDSITAEINPVIITKTEMYLTDKSGNRLSSDVAEYGIAGFDYEMPIVSVEMQQITDLRIYLDAIKDIDATAFLAVSEDAGFLMPEAVAQRMEAIGLETDLRDYKGDSYAAVLDDGQVIEEEVSDGPIWIKGRFEEPWMYYNVKSSGSLAGEYYREMDFENGYYWFSGTRGLGIAVFDKYTGSVVDQVVFDIYDGVRCIRE